MFFRRHNSSEEKEKVISAKQQQLERKMDKDINAFKKLNAVLDNGITLEIKKGLGSKHV